MKWLSISCDFFPVISRLCFLTLLSFVGKAWAQSPPTQATSGPGSSDYSHADVTIFDHGQGNDGFWIFEPANPTPDSADVVVFTHGQSMYNPNTHGAWVKHMVRRGNIVIYPKYQDNTTTPTPDYPMHALNGIKAALDSLNQPGHVVPRLDHFAMVGHSYGGIISTNLTILADSFNLPEVKALLVCQGYYGNDVALPSYAPVPYDTKMLMIVGANDVVVGSTFGRLLMDSAQVNPAYINLVTHYPDAGGFPVLTAGHEDALAWDNQFDSGETNIVMLGAQVVSKTDAVDFYCFWKLTDALLECAFYNQNCDVAFGDTPAQRFMGEWSDGSPALELDIETRNTTATEEDLHSFMDFTVGPNPSSGEIKVDLFNQRAGSASLQLFDLMGQEVTSFFETKAFIQGEKWTTTVQLPAGTYWLKLSVDDQFQVKRLQVH